MRHFRKMIQYIAIYLVCSFGTNPDFIFHSKYLKVSKAVRCEDSARRLVTLLFPFSSYCSDW
jgi:hypothetical protein